MKKEVVIGALVVIVVLGGIILYAAFRTLPSPGGQVNENEQYYTVTASWPTTTPLAKTAGSAADHAAVALMQQDVQTTIGYFMSDIDVASITPEVAQEFGLSPTNKYSLNVSYEATSSPSTDSYIFTIYEDTLGAHPNTTYITETFDAATGAHLSLSELFNPGTDVLGELSTLSQQQLPPIIAAQEGSDLSDVDMGMLDTGTTPDPNNFQWFYLADGNLVLLFPPYEVGPFSLGTVTLPLPLASIPNLKNQYR